MAMPRSLRNLAPSLGVLALGLLFMSVTANTKPNWCKEFYQPSDKILLGEGKFATVFLYPKLPGKVRFAQKVYQDPKICHEDVALMVNWEKIFSQTNSIKEGGFSLAKYRNTNRSHIAEVQYIEGETLRAKLLDLRVSEAEKEVFRNAFNSNIADAIRRFQEASYDRVNVDEFKPGSQEYEVFFRDSENDGTSVFIIYLDFDFLIVKSDNIIIEDLTKRMFVIDPR